jgi:hypothetical protein
MHVSRKMISVETVSGVGGRERMKENGEGVNSSMIYLTYCKNFCKCHNVPQSTATIKNIIKERRNEGNSFN